MKRPEVVRPESCSGCGLCELACSFHNGADASFRPSAAHLHAVRVGGLNRFRIEFGPHCNGCGLCAAHCAYGVFGEERPAAEAP